MWSGSNCELGGGPCDNVFELCVKHFPPLPTSSSNNNCLYYVRTSDFEGTTIDFEQVSTGIDKDIKLNFAVYTVNLTCLSRKCCTLLSLLISYFLFL